MTKETDELIESLRASIEIDRLTSGHLQDEFNKGYTAALVAIEQILDLYEMMNGKSSA